VVIWRLAARALRSGLNSIGEIVNKEACAACNAAQDVCRRRFSLTGYALLCDKRERRGQYRVVGRPVE
jgi:hypothetical protein